MLNQYVREYGESLRKKWLQPRPLRHSIRMPRRGMNGKRVNHAPKRVANEKSPHKCGFSLRALQPDFQCRASPGAASLPAVGGVSSSLLRAQKNRSGMYAPMPGRNALRIA
jgi:hypothetical protein